jgi:predicted dehydrogenase
LLVEIDAERRAAALAAHPGIQVTDALAVALAEPAVDAVIVCTPSSTHFDVGREALRAGKSVFIEKPFATSLAAARELFDLAVANGLVAYPGHVFLHAPFLSPIKQLIEQGQLGELRYGVGQRASLGPRAREDASAVWDYLIHDVYIFHHLFGGPPVAVSARGSAYLRRGIEDAVFATLEYSGERLLNLYASWYAPERMRSLFLVGSEAMLQYDENRAEPLIVSRRGYRPHPGVDQWGNVELELFDDGAKAIPIESATEPLKVELQTFLAAVAGRRSLAAPASAAVAAAVTTIERHVLEVTATLEAIDRSMAARGERSTVESVPWRSQGRVHGELA